MGGWDNFDIMFHVKHLFKIIVDISIDSSIIYIYQELTWWSKNSMNHKIKNFFTFGVYDRLVKAECEVINLKESIASMDVDSQVEDEIIRRNILTEDNFSPSDYDLVSSDDYDFDDFSTDDDLERKLEDYYDADEVNDIIVKEVKESQGELVESMVKKVCTEMLVDWCERTAKAANKQEKTESSSDNS